MKSKQRIETSKGEFYEAVHALSQEKKDKLEALELRETIEEFIHDHQYAMENNESYEGFADDMKEPSRKARARLEQLRF